MRWHLWAVLSRQQLCETNEESTDLFFGSSLESHGIALLPFLLTAALALGKGRVLPHKPRESSTRDHADSWLWVWHTRLQSVAGSVWTRPSKGECPSLGENAMAGHE